MACSCDKNGAVKANDGSTAVWEGSRQSGARQTLLYGRKNLPIHSVSAPNKIFFSENPFLNVGDKFKLQNIEVAKNLGVRVISKCQTVTTASALVNGLYEVVTDDTITTASAAAVIFGSTTGTSRQFFGCDTTATAAASKTLEAVICSGTILPANFSGSVYVDPPGTAPRGFAANVVVGSNLIEIVESRVRIKEGDKIELLGTALSGATTATAQQVIRGGKSGSSSVVKLSAPVTGVSAANARGEACVQGIASTQAVAALTFTVNCGCAIEAVLPAAITSAATWPTGRPVEGSTCGQSEYCYTISDSTPDAEIPYFNGILVI